MSILCPACGKTNEGITECQRCRCELAILQRITKAADALLRDAQKSLSIGDAAAAVDQAKKSWQLKKSPEAARLAFLSNLAIGDFTQARKWYSMPRDRVENHALLSRQD